jgi:hypothetical protein
VLYDNTHSNLPPIEIVASDLICIEIEKREEMRENISMLHTPISKAQTSLEENEMRDKVCIVDIA